MWLRCSRSTFSLFAFCSDFFLSACDEWTGRLLPTAWTRPVELSSPRPKAGLYMFGHLRCQFIRTVMPFELLLYHELIFAFFGFAVCFSCQNRSLFLCIEFCHCNKQKQIHTGFIQKYHQFTPSEVCSAFRRRKVRPPGLMSSCPWQIRETFSACPWGHPRVIRLWGPYSIYILSRMELIELSLSAKPLWLQEVGTDRYLWSNCVVWNKKKTFCFWNLLCPTLIVASGAQIRTLCFGLVLFLIFDYGARIEGIVTHVLLCETLYRVYYYHF